MQTWVKMLEQLLDKPKPASASIAHTPDQVLSQRDITTPSAAPPPQMSLASKLQQSTTNPQMQSLFNQYPQLSETFRPLEQFLTNYTQTQEQMQGQTQTQNFGQTPWTNYPVQTNPVFPYQQENTVPATNQFVGQNNYVDTGTNQFMDNQFAPQGNEAVRDYANEGSSVPAVPAAPQTATTAKAPETFQTPTQKYDAQWAQTTATPVANYHSLDANSNYKNLESYVANNQNYQVPPGPTQGYAKPTEQHPRHWPTPKPFQYNLDLLKMYQERLIEKQFNEEMEREMQANVATTVKPTPRHLVNLPPKITAQSQFIGRPMQAQTLGKSVNSLPAIRINPFSASNPARDSRMHPWPFALKIKVIPPEGGNYIMRIKGPLEALTGSKSKVDLGQGRSRGIPLKGLQLDANPATNMNLLAKGKYIMPVNRDYQHPPSQDRSQNPIVYLKVPRNHQKFIELTTSFPNDKAKISSDKKAQTKDNVVSMKLPFNVSLATVLKNIYENMFVNYLNKKPSEILQEERNEGLRNKEAYVGMRKWPTGRSPESQNGAEATGDTAGSGMQSQINNFFKIQENYMKYSENNDKKLSPLEAYRLAHMPQTPLQAKTVQPDDKKLEMGPLKTYQRQANKPKIFTRPNTAKSKTMSGKFQAGLYAPSQQKTTDVIGSELAYNNNRKQTNKPNTVQNKFRTLTAVDYYHTVPNDLGSVQTARTGHSPVRIGSSGTSNYRAPQSNFVWTDAKKGGIDSYGVRTRNGNYQVPETNAFRANAYKAQGRAKTSFVKQFKKFAWKDIYQKLKNRTSPYQFPPQTTKEKTALNSKYGQNGKGQMKADGRRGNTFPESIKMRLYPGANMKLKALTQKLLAAKYKDSSSPGLVQGPKNGGTTANSKYYAELVINQPALSERKKEAFDGENKKSLSSNIPLNNQQSGNMAGRMSMFAKQAQVKQLKPMLPYQRIIQPISYYSAYRKQHPNQYQLSLPVIRNNRLIQKVAVPQETNPRKQNLNAHSLGSRILESVRQKQGGLLKSSLGMQKAQSRQALSTAINQQTVKFGPLQIPYKYLARPIKIGPKLRLVPVIGDNNQGNAATVAAKRVAAPMAITNGEQSQNGATAVGFNGLHFQQHQDGAGNSPADRLKIPQQTSNYESHIHALRQLQRIGVQNDNLGSQQPLLPLRQITQSGQQRSLDDKNPSDTLRLTASISPMKLPQPNANAVSAQPTVLGPPLLDRLNHGLPLIELTKHDVRKGKGDSDTEKDGKTRDFKEAEKEMEDQKAAVSQGKPVNLISGPRIVNEHAQTRSPLLPLRLLKDDSEEKMQESSKVLSQFLQETAPTSPDDWDKRKSAIPPLTQLTDNDIVSRSVIPGPSQLPISDHEILQRRNRFLKTRLIRLKRKRTDRSIHVDPKDTLKRSKRL